MKKPYNSFLVLLFFFLFAGQSFAQVLTTVELLPDNITYRVSLRPDVSYPAPLNVTNNAQFTFVVPTGGFSVGTVTNLTGLWSNSNSVIAPTENPDGDYLIFNLVSGTSDIVYLSGQEVPLFEFTNSGNCTGTLNFVDENDPFSAPNSQSVNIGNLLTVLGAGQGVNPYSGTYGEEQSCEGTSSGCGITVNSVTSTSPSACGVADGVITINAINENAIPLQYSIDGSNTWQSENVFEGLAAGDYFELHVRDIAAICSFEYGVVDLDAPLAAVVTLYETGKPDCNGGTNGFINIEATNENNDPMEFSINSSDWQNTGYFSGLSEATYYPVIRNLNNNCQVELGPENLSEDCSGGCTDNDNDGLCEGEDCDDNNPDLPATPGSTCDDGNPLTIQDVILADGCTCQGEVEMGCIDNDNDGFCEADDCDDDNPNLPATVGSTCDDGNNQTINDIIQADGCTCQGEIDNGGENPSCFGDIEIILNTDGKYEVALTPNVSYSFPNNITSTAQFTIRVPTGIFEISNFENSISNVVFEQNSTTIAPIDAPEFDYFSFGLVSTGTQDIPYVAGERVALFTFENIGSCENQAIVLMNNELDPFYPPNSQNVNSGQQITVSGWGADAPICLGANSSVNCPGQDPEDPACIVNFEIEKMPSGEFQVSINPSVTYNAPDNITSTAQVTVKVPTASGSNTGFLVEDLQNILPGVLFAESGRQNAPDEDPMFDYISFGLQTMGTSGITYEAGVKVPLFTFRNGGTCEELPVSLMINQNDPFFPPNSANANVGQQITVAGWGSGGTPVCVSNPEINDCDVFEPVTEILIFNISLDEPNEVCVTEVLDIPNGIGSVSLCNTPENITVITEDGNDCIEITSQDDFSGLAEICVLICDETQTDICDTTYLYLCPEVNAGADVEICPSENIELSVSGGTGDFIWSPSTGLSCTDCANPIASPTETTEYTVSSTSEFCETTSTITVAVNALDFIEESLIKPSNCGDDNGSISLTLQSGEVPYTLTLSTEMEILEDNISLDGTETAFGDLSAATYSLILTGSSGCADTTMIVIEEVDADFGIVELIENTTCSTQVGSIELTNTPTSATYDWSDSEGNTYPNSNFLEDLGAGVYTVVITADDCIQTLDYNVVATDAAEIVDLYFTEYVCNGENNGTVSFSVDGMSNYTYEITTEGIEPIIGIAETAIPAFENGLAAGMYIITVIDQMNGCSSFVEFTILENTELTINAIPTQSTDCDNPNGSICLEITGGISPYSISANAGTVMESCIEFLSNQTVSITLTDSVGCQISTEVIMEDNCNEDCDLITPDNITVDAFNGNATLCLPTEGLDLEEFIFTLNGETFTPTIGECPNQYVLYLFSFVLESGEAPYRIVSWNYGTGIMEDTEFSTFGELTDLMNNALPAANWELNEDDSTIRGFRSNTNIGPLNIEHIGTGSSFELPLSGANVAYQSIDIEATTDQMLVVTDPLNNCIDSVLLTINNQEIESQNDTIYLTAFLNTTLMDVCLDTTQFTGILEGLTVCTPAENGMIEVQTMSCLNYQPNLDYLGDDQFCITLCDENGICQTTIFIVEVITNELIIYNGFSPNGDGVNDVFFIRNIELFPNNKLSIYNRWGNRVYRTEEYRNTYSGDFDGKDLPDGTYFYMLEINEDMHTGYLHLKR